VSDPDRDRSAPPAAGRAESPAPDGRGGFLGFVAHEMRNPLATALWSAELLVRLSPEERAGPRGDKLAGMALRALQRLRFLVEDHFLAERLDVAGLPLRVEPVALGEVLDAIDARKGALELTRSVEGDLVLLADRGMLERALDAVIAFAGRSKVPVALAARRSDGRALIHVRGAPPEPDALAPPHKGTASDPTGHALALHMALRVALAMGGALTISEGGYLFSVPLGSAGDVPENAT
jgi:phospho-acceptor domain-containing protein